MKGIILRALAAFACILFAISILYPFLRAEGFSAIPEIVSIPVTFWSFREVYAIFYMGHFYPAQTMEFWFTDYWHHAGLGSVEGSVLILTFNAQLLTVLSAILAVYLRRLRSLWLLLTGVCNVVTVFCMWSFSQLENNKFGLHIIGFDVGYWLALASAILFLAIFFVS